MLFKYADERIRRDDSTDPCHICCAPNAVWLVNSSPKNDGKPFFPFLQYQNVNTDTNKLDNNGRAPVCNLCYIFLTQQWKCYEQSRTPLLKRIYWLKHPLSSFGNDVKFCRTFEENENVFESTWSNVRTVSDSQQHNLIKELKCNICSVIQPVDLLSYAHTQPQESIDVPFYPGIPTNLDDGRFLVCKTCHSYLHHQWLEYEAKGTQHSQRQYRTINQYLEYHQTDEHKQMEEKKPIPKELVSTSNIASLNCYLCNGSIEKISVKTFCKEVEKYPFFPFLRNINGAANSFKIDSKGYTFCCMNCYHFLVKQWDSYENLDVSQPERVYRIDESQPPFSQTPIDEIEYLMCFICSENNVNTFWKRIYYNKGSNMNLNFLEVFTRKKNAYFSNETGETFVCASCFEELKQHWQKYQYTLYNLDFLTGEDGKELVIPSSSCYDNKQQLLEEKGLDSNYVSEKKAEYKVADDMSKKDNVDFKKSSQMSNSLFGSNKNKQENCQICSESVASCIPLASSQCKDTVPFFPLLQKYKEYGTSTYVHACQICAINLLNQWKKYSEDNVELTSRTYRTDEFACSLCNNIVLRKDIDLIAGQPSSSSAEVLVCKVCLPNSKLKKINSKNKTDGNSSESKARPDQQSTTITTGAPLPGNSNSPGMKATATVSPFLNFNMRNHMPESQHSPNLRGSSDQGGSEATSFAAALRKLAQQTPTPHGQSVSSNSSRERRLGSPPMQKGGDERHMFHHAPRDMHMGGNPSMIAPPVIPPQSIHHDALIGPREAHEKQRKENNLHFQSFHEQEEMSHRHGRFEKRPSVSSNAPPQKSAFKERSTNGIVIHPKPIHKHQDEESVKTSGMNSMHFPPRDGAPSIHSLSPSEISRFSGSFSVPSHQAQHSHGLNSSCPVHGHERGEHPHDERNSRAPPSGMPFDLPSLFPRDMHSMHSQHPRMREELQYLHGRHAVERKEHVVSHHAFDDELRRRNLDYRWGGVPPHLLDEQYRRHLLNSGHEHPPGFKEQAHGKMFLPPFYYGNGREHPFHVDPFMPLPHALVQGELHHRQGPPVSPRMLDYYRREHVERSRAEFDHRERRHSDERREKEMHNDLQKKSIDAIVKKNEEILHERARHNTSRSSEQNNDHHGLSSTRKVAHVPVFQGLDYQMKHNRHAAANAHQINSIIHTKLPDPKTELAAASILASMNRINQSPCSDEVESLTSSVGPDQLIKQIKTEQVDDTNEPLLTEEKENFMSNLGLVSRSRKRALEDEYERKRFERKMRKFRGRPKKRSKRENTEESSVNGDSQRSGSELDFYSGPMTRHKQQLLQEQETLLEQIQKRNSTDEVSDENGNLIKLRGNTNTPQNSANNEITGKKRRSPRTSPNKSDSNEEENQIDKRKSPNKLTRRKQGDSIPSSSSSITNRDHSIGQNGRLYDILRDKPNNLQGSFRQMSPRQQTLEKHLKNDHSINRIPSTSQHLAHHQHFDFPKHPLEVSKHVNSSRVDFHDDIKTLDNSLFGRYVEGNTESFIRWPGIEPLAHAYSAYIADHDMQRQRVLQTFEELQRESRCLKQKREYLDKDMVVYNDRRIHIAEKRREMRHHMEILQRALRTIASNVS